MVGSLSTIVGVLLGVVVALKAMRVSYTNGVTDGYGYSQEPNNPGYAGAGEYLRKHMKHRWPALQYGEVQVGDDNGK